MANKYDIESLRSEGMQAVANSQNYTTAAVRGNGHARVTITNPELTGHERKLFDLYDMDAGMNLSTLGGDIELFNNAVTAMKSAVERQRGQVQALAALWEGVGAEAANDFLKTHNVTAEAVTKEFGLVSKGLDGLRETLWSIASSKKEASTLVDDLVTERSQFDSAVATYRTGAGDKSQADETNDTMIGPHVKKNIEGNWLPAMQNAKSKFGDAYDTLIGALKQDVPSEFKLPYELGPDIDSGSKQPGDDQDPNKQKDNDGDGIPDNGGDGTGTTTGTGTGTGTTTGTGTGTGTATGGMQGTATPASGMGNYGGGQMPGQQTGQGQGQGMDPSQIVSGITGALTGVMGSIGEAVNGIVSGITEGISSIPFDELGQGGGSGPDDKPEDKFDGKADEAADKKDDDAKDPDAKMAAAKEAAIDEARADAGGTFATDGKPAPGIQLAGAGGLEATPTTPPGQTTPGAPLGTTPAPGAVPPPTGGSPAAQPMGQMAPATPPPAQQPAPHQPEPAPAAQQPPAQPQGADAGETPCEIAADELPKAGR